MEKFEYYSDNFITIKAEKNDKLPPLSSNPEVAQRAGSGKFKKPGTMHRPLLDCFDIFSVTKKENIVHECANRQTTEKA